MAQVIITDQEALAASWRAWVRAIVIGAIVGVVFWILTLLIERYIIDPLVCSKAVNATLCAGSLPLAGTISTILAGVVGIVLMVRGAVARPIIIAVATAALLWDLAAWTEGLFWLESFAWSVALYALVFALFAWITRHSLLWVTIVLSVLIVVIIRIALVL